MAIALNGCAESLVVRTFPSGAKVTVNGAFAGLTPIVYEVPRGQVGTLHYRIEKENSRPVDGTAEPLIAPGRIVAVVFTSGIYFAFHGLRYYPDVEVELQPMTATARSDKTAADRLEDIQDLYDRGLISEREYKRMRSGVLDELRGVE